MKTPGLEFDVQFVAGERGQPEERATMADVCIRVRGQAITRCENGWARSTGDRIRVSCHPLATWIASSWWRLLAEADSTDPSPRAEWCMAHHMAAAGGGFLWPRVQFLSDGAFIEVIARPSPPSAAEPLRFVGEVRESLPAREVERSFAEFISTVVERLHALDIADSDLQQVWADIEAERADPEVRAHRQMEAAMGLDPDTMGDDLRADVERLRANLGDHATNEVAAGGSAAAKRMGAHDYLQDVLHSLASRGTRATFDSRLRPIGTRLLPGHPWQQGTELAQRIRRDMKVGVGPVSTAVLHEWIGLGRARTPAATAPGGVLAMARREGASATLYCRKNHPQARRFELARFIGDHLIAPGAEVGLVQSEATTVRQKVQRAFAAELLAPIGDLQNALAGDYTRHAIESVAADFDVSTYVVTSQLVNSRAIPAVDGR